MLSALPWVGRELYEKKESELDRMLGSLEGYIKRRNKTHHGALRVFISDAPHPQEEVSFKIFPCWILNYFFENPCPISIEALKPVDVVRRS